MLSLTTQSNFPEDSLTYIFMLLQEGSWDFTTRNMRFSHHFQVSFVLAFFPFRNSIFISVLIWIRCSPTCIVGCHRYIVKNFTSGPLDEMVEEEVDEFDLPSEVFEDLKTCKSNCLACSFN